LEVNGAISDRQIADIRRRMLEVEAAVNERSDLNAFLAEPIWETCNGLFGKKACVAR
jgi:hypothetical protein